jgi:uncharacterized membrane protein
MPAHPLRQLTLSAEWRREALRTNLWFVPAVEIAAAVALFLVTHRLDRAAYEGHIALPSWVISGSADAARQILTALAAAVITVVGVVFSIMIVTLTLASTQFGPRMLRNFIRDRATQLTLGTFVASFVYAMLALVSIGPGAHGDFVPHVSITATLALVVADIGMLIFFIHHIATSIQLPHVIAAIAGDLRRALETEGAAGDHDGPAAKGPSVSELERRMAEGGGVVPAPTSGYLQYVNHATLVRIATEAGAVIHLHHRPGHFIVAGHPMATVWPAHAAPEIERGLRSAHAIGPTRTLSQDVAFAVDQLVEIAIRALSPAVNDTFTALTCVDWLGDSLCRVPRDWSPSRVHRDAQGYIRVTTVHVSYARLVQRAFEKIRQAARGMPAVLIRQLDALTVVMQHASTEPQRHVLLQQGAMILRAAEESVPEAADRADVERAHRRLLEAADLRTADPSAPAPTVPAGAPEGT